ncbi:MAG: hypothetical protein ABWY00_05940 [Dongiaceae bacterium]
MTLAVFTGLLAGALESLTLAQAPILLAACLAGFLSADILLTYVVGLRAVQSLYRRYERWILRLTGVLFIGFAVNALFLFRGNL